MHLDRGFSLIENNLGSPAKVVWSYSFEKLRASADDGTRTLFLDFGGDEGEIVSFKTSFILTPTVIDYLLHKFFSGA